MDPSLEGHPRLRMMREAGDLVVLLPVRPGRSGQLLDLLWLSVWIVVEGLLLLSMDGPSGLPVPRSWLIRTTILFALAGLFLLSRVVWYRSGQERFRVGSGWLRAERGMLGIGRERVFLREEIQAIRGRKHEVRRLHPFWGRLFIGPGNGEILVEAGGKEFAYGKGLGLREAERLAELLRFELADAASHPRTGEGWHGEGDRFRTQASGILERVFLSPGARGRRMEERR